MPIRFRCPHCSRLLGIARRKAGTRINCPQCAAAVTVPVPDGATEPDLNEIDDLMNPVAGANGEPPPPPVPLPDPTDLPDLPDPEPGRPAVATRSPRPAPPLPPQPAAPRLAPAAPRGKPHRRKDGGNPLFEQDDVDALLGFGRPNAAFNFEDGSTGPRAKPVSGMDAMSLDEGHGPTKIVLSPQKAMLLVVGVVFLLGLAFAAGFLIASNL